MADGHSQLRLPLRYVLQPAAGDDEDADDAEPTGARTAPVMIPKPRRACPQCRDAEHVHKLWYWPELKTWVWHCSARPRVRGRRQARGVLCGHTWIDTQLSPRCHTCTSEMLIERRRTTVGFWCEACVEFYHY